MSYPDPQNIPDAPWIGQHPDDYREGLDRPDLDHDAAYEAMRDREERRMLNAEADLRAKGEADNL